MNREFPEQEYIVDSLIPCSSLIILSGREGSYKTYTLLELAISIASGEPFLGQFKTTKSGVLIIDEENGPRLIQKRLKQLGAKQDLSIFFTPKQGFTLIDEDIEGIISACKAHDIKLVIIDSMVRVHKSEENSSRDMAKIAKQLRRFTREDIAVLVTHHNRKQGPFSGGASTEMRGSSEIAAALDCHIGIVLKNKRYLRFDQTKQRYDLRLEPFEVKVSNDKDSFHFEYLGTSKSPADKSEQLQTAVTEILSEYDGLQQKDILEKLSELGTKTNEHTLRDLLHRLELEGLIQPPSRALGNSKVYRLNKTADNE